MFRILIALLIAYLAFRIIRWAVSRLFVGRNLKIDSANPGEMVACARCSTFILRSEALRDGDKFYCSESCRRSG